MGHPAYYFLSGVTIAFVLSYYTSVIKFLGVILGRAPKTSVDFLTKEASLQTHFIEKIKRLQKSKAFSKLPWIYGCFPDSFMVCIKFNRKFAKTALACLCCVLIAFALVNFVKRKLQSMENKNIHEMQTYFNSLHKTPMGADPMQKTVQLPSSMVLKTIGIYCEMGPMDAPKEVKIEFFFHGKGLYTTKILPVVGKDVMLFVPVYLARNTAQVKIEDNNQCKSYYWSDLKDWKGAFWEGSYDRNTLMKE